MILSHQQDPFLPGCLLIFPSTVIVIVVVVVAVVVAVAAVVVVVLLKENLSYTQAIVVSCWWEKIMLVWKHHVGGKGSCCVWRIIDFAEL